MHDDVLSNQASAFVPMFAGFKEFYVDFDFFSSRALPDRLLEQIKRAVAPHPVVVTYRSDEQLNLIINEVKVTFLSFGYEVVEPLVPYRGLSLLGVREIASLKALAIGKRLAYKDYVDWFYVKRWICKFG